MKGSTAKAAPRKPWELSATEEGCADVLTALRRSAGPVSGAALSQALGLSRNAIWKYVLALRERGYQIAAAPRRGYTLLAAPDTPYSWEVMCAGSTKWLGRASIYLSQVDSTNNYAKELARQGAPHGLCVFAEEQTAGRGRRGRHWVSQPGGLVFTVVFRPTCSPAMAPCLTLCIASAVTAAVATECNLQAMVKWPNDVLVAGKKVCGILVEMSADPEEIHWLVAGIGVNVNMDLACLPQEVQATATSLAAASGGSVPRLPLLHAVLAGLERRYERLMNGDVAGLIAEARSLSATIGRQVTVWDNAGNAITGLAEDIAADGALCIRQADGTLSRFYAGDVTLHPQPMP